MDFNNAIVRRVFQLLVSTEVLEHGSESKDETYATGCYKLKLLQYCLTTGIENACNLSIVGA